MMTRNSMIALLLIFSTWHVFCQDTTSGHLLDSVIYTAFRTPVTTERSGRTVEILDVNKIQNAGITSFSELLNSESGIGIVGATNMPGQIQNIYSRGTGSNQTNILINGLRLTNPFSTNNVLDLSELSLSGVERIEITKGNQSCLYGLSSVGATINIITTTPTHSGWKITPSLLTGAYNKQAFIFNPSIDIGYKTRRDWSFYSGGYYYTTNGANATIDTITDPNAYKFNKSDRDGFTKTDMWIGTSKKWNRLDLSVYTRQHLQHSQLDKEAYFDDGNAFAKSRRGWVQAALNYKINTHSLISLQSGYSTLKYRFSDDSSVINAQAMTDGTVVRSDYKASSQNHELQYKYSLDFLDIMTGLSAYQEKMNFNTDFYSSVFNFGIRDTFNKSNQTTSALYSQLWFHGQQIAKALRNLDLIIAGRITHHSQFGWIYSADFNPSYHFGHSTIFGSISSGITAPSIYQLYSPENNFGGTFTRGNPDLRPVTSVHYETGYRFNPSSKTSLTVSAFALFTRNDIEYVYVWNRTKPIQDLQFDDFRGDTYLNVGKTSVRGLEIDFKTAFLQKWQARIQSSIFTGGTRYNASQVNDAHTGPEWIQLYNSGKFISTVADQSELVRRPSKIKLQLQHQLNKKTGISIQHLYTSRRYDSYYNEQNGPFGALNNELLKPYHITNVNIDIKWSKHLKTVLRFENIFDSKYSEIRGYASRGRGVYLYVTADIFSLN
ncbi:MAG: TonB-dependent receptor [Saprospiraceae bacterium]